MYIGWKSIEMMPSQIGQVIIGRKGVLLKLKIDRGVESI